jgi:hypothetical protein
MASYRTPLLCSPSLRALYRRRARSPARPRTHPRTHPRETNLDAHAHAHAHVHAYPKPMLTRAQMLCRESTGVPVGSTLLSSTPLSLHPSIPLSLHPFIPLSLYPSIPLSLSLLRYLRASAARRLRVALTHTPDQATAAERTISRSRASRISRSRTSWTTRPRIGSSTVSADRGARHLVVDVQVLYHRLCLADMGSFRYNSMSLSMPHVSRCFLVDSTPASCYHFRLCPLPLLSPPRPCYLVASSALPRPASPCLAPLRAVPPAP